MSDAEIINIVSAHMDGRKIQCRGISIDQGDWFTPSDNFWDFYHYEYRVAPRENPIEKWLNLRRDGGWSWYETKEEAEKYRTIDISEIVHLREVIE